MISLHKVSVQCQTVSPADNANQRLSRNKLLTSNGISYFLFFHFVFQIFSKKKKEKEKCILQIRDAKSDMGSSFGPLA
jgi:hypothetical protein